MHIQTRKNLSIFSVFQHKSDKFHPYIMFSTSLEINFNYLCNKIREI